MAVRGTKPKPVALRLVQGNPGKRPLPSGEPTSTGSPRPPKPLEGRAAVLWEAYIAPAFWLGAADGFKAFMWVVLAAEFDENPAAMSAARIGQLRVIGSELGLDPSSRARLGAGHAKPPGSDPAEQFFR